MINKKLLAGIAALAALLSACGTSPPADTSLFRQWYYSYSVLLSPTEPKGSPKLNLSMTLLETKERGEIGEFFYAVLYGGESPEEYKDSVIREQRDLYRHARRSVDEDPESGNDPSFNWRFSEVIDVKTFPGTGIVIERDREYFSGGAHSSITKRYYVLDMEGKKVLTLHDMILDFENPYLMEILFAALRDYSGSRGEPIEAGMPLSTGIYLVDDPKLSLNFFVTEEGLGLHWDPYELAPRSEGRIEVVLPWRSVRPYMAHFGMEAMTRFGIYLFVADVPGKGQRNTAERPAEKPAVVHNAEATPLIPVF
jgi:hypothetical protein